MAPPQTLEAALAPLFWLCLLKGRSVAFQLLRPRHCGRAAAPAGAAVQAA